MGSEMCIRDRLNINSQKHWKNEMKKLGGEYLLWSESPENPISN